MCANKKSTSIVYDERCEAFQAVCEKHGAYVQRICMDCENQFLCVYCINREHKDHHHDTLENQVEITKVMLSSELKKIKKDIPNLNLSYKDELKKIGKLRNNLRTELQERVMKKLNEYTVSLNQQTNDLLQKFDSKVNEFGKILDEFGLAEHDYETAFSKYIEKTNAKPNFEILSEKDGIIRQSEILASVHCFMASLTDYEPNEASIGDLQMSIFQKKEIHENIKIIELNLEKSYKQYDDIMEALTQLKKYNSGIDIFPFT